MLTEGAFVAAVIINGLLQYVVVVVEVFPVVELVVVGVLVVLRPDIICIKPLKHEMQQKERGRKVQAYLHVEAKLGKRSFTSSC